MPVIQKLSQNGTFYDEINKINELVDAYNNVSVAYAAYPIGSIYIGTTTANPATLFGFGTWAIFAPGRVLVGVDSGDPTFNTGGLTGGEKAHALSAAENGPHDHTPGDTAAGTMYGLLPKSIAGQGTTVGGVDSNGSGFEPNVVAPPVQMQTSGTGLPHNNLQPYITVYMWRRTA